MADDDGDFTFCQVSPLVDVDEANKVTNGIKEIHIEDVNANAADSSSSRNEHGDSIWKVNASSHKHGTVGSLTFNVINTSPREDVSQLPEERALEVAGSSNKASPETKAPVRKTVARAKVPFEKGYSPMDWLKLTRTHPDLAGLKGQSNRRLIPLSEVKKHKSEGSMWTVLKGRVYNITPYMKFHPGGEEILMKAVGRDCTIQ